VEADTSGAAVTTRIDIDDPEVDMDYGQRLLYRGELFRSPLKRSINAR
jgi:hypothetical protein